MMRLVVAHEARKDLRNIVHYTAREWGAAQKSRYMAELRERFQLLLRNPDLGASREDLKSDYRSLLSGSHVIFYRRKADEIHIVRILHQRMDAKLHL